MIEAIENIMQSDVLNDEISLKDALRLLKIDDRKEHFAEEEFTNLVEIMSRHKVASKDYIRQQIKGYKKTIETYKTIEEWEAADKDNKFIVKGSVYTNGLYYQAMILSRRLNVSWANVDTSYKMIPETLSKVQLCKIIRITRELGYKKSTELKILNIIRKIMICSNKELTELDRDDIQNYKDSRDNISKKKSTMSILNVLRELKIISSEDVFYLKKIKSINQKEIVRKNSELFDIYIKFVEKDKAISYLATYDIRKRCAKNFLEWVEREYPMIKDIKELEPKQTIKYFEEMKNSKKKNNERKFSQETINGYLAHFKSGLLKYLKDNNFLNKELDAYVFSGDAKYNQLYYEKSKRMHKPIKLQDRLAIEEAIYLENCNCKKIFYKMFILLYQLALRPFELLLLKVDCLRGTKELPQLYVHRSKKFKQRYIPLTIECLDIINELREANKYSPDIYSDIDGLSCKRLFNYKGSVPTIVALEENFSNMLIDNKIIKPDGKAKFTLYVLRRLRITSWLEAGISADIVANLVGHDDVDSHNYYIVSKEIRIENCKKVFDKFYSNLFSEEEDIIDKNIIEKDFIQELNESLLAIENKTINKLAMESIVQEFPEYILPVSCGMCVAKAFEEDFECEMMNIPCIECEELKKDSIDILRFDDLAFRIFKNISTQRKKDLSGLIEKSNKKIDRLKIFYENKFKLSDKEVEKRFKEIEISTIIKRGRKRKEVVMDE